MSVDVCAVGPGAGCTGTNVFRRGNQAGNGAALIHIYVIAAAGEQS
jgi:hypothetical protein